MNFKTLGMSAAIATSVVTGAVVMNAPAQASTLNFSGSNRLTDLTSSTAKLEFANVNTTLSTDAIFGGPAIFGDPARPLTLSTLNLTKDLLGNYSLAGSPVSWISGLLGGRTFSLTSFNLSNAGAGSFGGFYTPGVDGPPEGVYTTQGGFKSIGSSFSATVTAVPTPALLPGLIAMGVGIMRKRKSEAAAESVA